MDPLSEQAGNSFPEFSFGPRCSAIRPLRFLTASAFADSSIYRNSIHRRRAKLLCKGLVCCIGAYTYLGGRAFVSNAQAQSEPVSMRMFASGSTGDSEAVVEATGSPEFVTTREEHAVQLNEQGVELVFQGEHDKGIAKIKQALAHDPQNTTILYNLAGMYLAKNQAEEAVGIMKRAVELEPKEISFQTRLAEAALLSKDLPTAVDAFENITGEEPGNGEALLKLGTLYAMQKRWPESEKTLFRAKEILGEDQRVLVNLANVLVVQEKFAAALPLFEVAQEKDPCKENAVAIALTYEGMGKLSEAIEHYREAKELGETGEDLEEHIEKLESALRSASTEPGK